METTLPLALHAHLPSRHHWRRVLTTTVDATGRAHWLLGERSRTPEPYSALLVTVADGSVHETELHGLAARSPVLDALPEGGFVIADKNFPVGWDARDASGRDVQAQIFTPRGRPTHRFSLGGELGCLHTDQNGAIWVGYSDDTAYAYTSAGAAGLARWDIGGARQWTHAAKPADPSRENDRSYCDVLNVDQDSTWAFSADLGLLGIHADAVTERHISAGIRALAVHDETLAHCDGTGRLTLCTLTRDRAEPVGAYGLTRPDGSPLGSDRAVGHGPNLYVHDGVAWYVLEL
ncbi:hypothetical protein [Spirillospora sp. NBC_01491]|uniref:hypothetical protein n=1 Tax=Spirillospora sp. NBC_01491 TaxID=2976007 RepID=UPI002E34CCDC|nr:hypothetical protein [Spirillospora sp. NBC_01491]